MKNSIMNFVRKNKHKKRTLAIWVLTAYYRAQILLVPAKKMQKTWGERGKESPQEENKKWNYWYAMQISDEVNRIAEKTPWESKCLVRALTARYFLKRKGIPTTMYLGVGKDENNKMVAHCWLRLGKMYVTGGNGDGYAKVAKFCM